ncbi:hypothetical protein D3C75_1196180 [compost metagenome]
MSGIIELTYILGIRNALFDLIPEKIDGRAVLRLGDALQIAEPAHKLKIVPVGASASVAMSELREPGRNPFKLDAIFPLID